MMSSPKSNVAAERDVRRKPHVVILGGGFAGINAARALSGADVRITLVDRQNHHLFQPLLYQVATASLSPAEVASPIRWILRGQRNVEVWLDEAVDVKPADRVVRLRDTALQYDFLIVATGATHSYFGHPEWAAVAPGLKTVDDALEMRRRFLLAFEAAEREADPVARCRLLTFVIVGGGPTGVELAGAMAEIARTVIPREFRYVDTTTARVVLVEGLDRILPGFPESLSASARLQLEALGVEVATGGRVTRIDASGVELGELRIDAANVFWAAGVAGSSIGPSLGGELDPAGRVRVAPDLSVPGHPEIFVAGDLAHAERDGRALPGVAQVAIQAGRHAAAMIRADLLGKPREAFRYRDLGSLATIGRAAAVADFGWLRLSGAVAWFVWVVVHVFQLTSFRNRLLVMIQWAWAYVTFQRGNRVITGGVIPDLAYPRPVGAPSGFGRAGCPLPLSHPIAEAPEATLPASAPRVLDRMTA
jgi:NADH:ubiquinone reductase (H+-translocating)